MSREENFRSNMNCLNQWMINRENKKEISEFLKADHVSRVGIYGYGILGKRLVWELLNGDFPISWIMDRAAVCYDSSIKISRPEDVGDLDAVDMVIITSHEAVEEMEKLVLDNAAADTVISIEELVESIAAWGGQG